MKDILSVLKEKPTLITHSSLIAAYNIAANKYQDLELLEALGEFEKKREALYGEYINILAEKLEKELD